MKTTYIAFLVLLAGCASASAINIETPPAGAQLRSPFLLVADASSCESTKTVSMGYSLDYGTTTIVPSASLSAMVIAGDGTHALHVKCWGPQGAASEANLEITILSSVATPPSTNVIAVNKIQTLSSWKWNHDPGTPGSAAGTSAIVTSPSLSGSAREYSFSYEGAGGEIFHDSFGSDSDATHFIYDAEVYLVNPADIANIEMDMNQVIPNGDTVIYGVQCDGYSNTWDYTIRGTDGKSHWEHSNVVCPEPSTWSPSVWHHVQLAYSRDAAGVVTYEKVVLDGEESDFVDAVGNSASPLGWSAGDLLTNFQIDGKGASGSATAYVDNLTISRW